MWPNLEKTADFVTLTEDILIGKLHFLSSTFNSSPHDSLLGYINFIEVHL